MPTSGTAYHSLPTNKDALVDLLNAHIDQQIMAQAPYRCKCLFVHHYLKGVRHFPILNFSSGEVKYNYLDVKGNLQYKHQKMLARYDLLKTRFMQMDCYPKIKRRGMGLIDIRRRSVAQLFAESPLSPDQIEKTKDDAFTMLCKYGFVGLSTDLVLEAPDADGAVGITADMEVVHPFEILPYPNIETDNSKARGIIRRRWVPLEFIKNKLEDGANKGQVTRNKDRLKVRKIPYGQAAPDTAANDFVSASSGYGVSNLTSDAAIGKSPPEDREQEYVEVVELWLFGPTQAVTRYIMKIGDWIAQDEDLSGSRYFCPLTHARFINDGSFYGQSPIDLMMPLNREIEKLVASLFENVRKTDRLGVILLPQGVMDAKSMFHDTGFGLKVGFVDVDPHTADFKPTLIQPPTSGDFPGKVATMANQMLDDIVPMSSVLYGEAPGRVDSASALSFLDQQTNIPISGAAASIRTMYGGQYRSIVNRMAAKAIDTNLKIPITRLSEDLVGVVLDRTTGGILMAENPIPDESRLEFTIQDEEPKSQIVRKQEALELLKEGVQTPEQFRMLGYKEGLDNAIYAPHEEAAWGKTILNIIIIFNDGKTPGKIMDNSYGMVPHIQIQVLDSFMARTEFLLASDSVRAMFVEYKKILMEQMGIKAPEGLMNPDDEAMLVGMASGQTPITAPTDPQAPMRQTPPMPNQGSSQGMNSNGQNRSSKPQQPTSKRS